MCCAEREGSERLRGHLVPPDVLTSVPERCAECVRVRATPAQTHFASATCLPRSPQSPLPPRPRAALRHFERSPEAGARAGHPLWGLRQPRTQGGISLRDVELGPARGGYSAAPGKCDREPPAARAFGRNCRLAPGELAAGSKGRGRARPLTHPVRASREGAGPSLQRRLKPTLTSWGGVGEGRKEQGGEQLSK